WANETRRDDRAGAGGHGCSRATHATTTSDELRGGQRLGDNRCFIARRNGRRCAIGLAVVVWRGRMRVADRLRECRQSVPASPFHPAPPTPASLSPCRPPLAN